MNERQRASKKKRKKKSLARLHFWRGGSSKEMKVITADEEGFMAKKGLGEHQTLFLYIVRL